jgi:alanine or glycine:cation symporter, AGCS family
VLFCAVVVVGAVTSPGAVIDFSDAAIFAMSVVNIIALYLLLPVVRRELAAYFHRLKSGEIRKTG